MERSHHDAFLFSPRKCWLSTQAENNWVQSIELYASKDSQADDEIYNSYNFCNNWDDRKFSFDLGTAEILNDYRFVESYPRRWILSSAIRLDLEEDGEIGELNIMSWYNIPYFPILVHLKTANVIWIQCIHPPLLHLYTILLWPWVTDVSAKSRFMLLLSNLLKRVINLFVCIKRFNVSCSHNFCVCFRYSKND